MVVRRDPVSLLHPEVRGRWWASACVQCETTAGRPVRATGGVDRRPRRRGGRVLLLRRGAGVAEAAGLSRPAALELAAAGEDWPETAQTQAVLVHLVEGDPSPHVRATAIRALLMRTGPDDGQRRAALDRARRDSSMIVRAAIVAGLSQGEETIQLPGGMVCRTWAVTESDGRVRHAAIEGLRASYWLERANIETLGNCAHTDPDPQVRSAALEALVEDWPGEPGVKDLVRALAESDPDPGARKVARTLFADNWG